jgi:3-dehydroquinate synthetase
MQLGLINRSEVEAIIQVLNEYGLPTQPEIPLDELYRAMRQDKKREGDFIHLVLLEKIGKAVTKKVSYSELQTILNDLRSHFG